MLLFEMDITNELSKECKKCNKILGISFFHKSKKGKHGVRSVCKECFSEWLRLWSKKNRKKINFYQRLRRRTHREKVLSIERKSKIKNRESQLKSMRDYYAKLRGKLFESYGNKCACCGETNKEFFAIDHINGGGGREKKLLGSRPLYKKIIEEGCPKDKYQILCHNCNMSIGFYGYCPHNPSKTRPLHRPQIPVIKIN